jgi:hypothetical protein
MAKTEIPAGDQPPPETKAGDSAIQSGADAKVTKASTGERVLIGFLLALVAIIAIGGLVLTIVLENKKRNEPKHTNWYDDFYREDNSFDDDNVVIEENPFEIDVSRFTADVAQPYDSVEDLREDIEVWAKALANSFILEQANQHFHHQYHNHDEWEAWDDGDVFFPVGSMAPSMEMSEWEDADVFFPVGEMAPSMEMSKESNSQGSVPDGFYRGVDDFETYEHEQGAVKDDMVKSNGAYVFSAIDNRIEVWDVEGNRFESTKIMSSSKYEHDIYIHALLMNAEGTNLIVIASDYSRHSYRDTDVVENKGETHVVAFDIEGSSLTQISQVNYDGYHSSSYIVGNDVHIVTKSSLNTWRHFDDHLYRYNYAASNNVEYVEMATAEAERIIPKFVDRVVEYVTQEDEILLSPIVGFPDGYKSITHVNSFDVSQIVEEGDMESNTSKSKVLHPGHTGYVYATADWLWVSDENWAWSPADTSSSTETTLLGFRLDGASTNFAAVTTIPGQLLSQFSIDFVKDDNKEYVRIAITQNSFDTRWWQPQPLPAPVFETPEVAASEPLISQSRTKNEIIIFEVPNAEDGVSQLVERGSVEVGKKDELITAIRFFDNISYVVTFERTDPFYVLDLSDPENPSVLGELEVPGFSEFMHPIKEDNSMLLTVGQDADELGRVTGFQISIFDSADPSDPKLVDRFVLEGGSSSASWDERAFRYIQVGDVGRLVIPVYEYSHDRFGQSINTIDGFSVFGVDLNKTEGMITREIDINHYSKSSYDRDSRGCYCGHVSLPQRSFIFDGNLMTIKSSKVISTDLASGEARWSMDLHEDEDCCNP